MLEVPPLRQPDNVTCVPTCVRAVLAFHGSLVSHEDAVELCGSTMTGTPLDHAISGLAEAGIEARLTQCRDIEGLRQAVKEGRPVVVAIRHPSGASHAVVVCDVGADAVTVMDPALGGYALLPIARFELLWCPLQNEALVIGAKSR